MEGLKRARRLVRREFDTLHRDLEGKLKVLPIDEKEVTPLFNLFNDNLEKLINLDNQIAEQLVQEGLSEEDENKEYDEVRGYRLRAETLRVEKEKLLPTKTTPCAESVTGGSNSAEGKVRNFKLPTVKITSFRGKLGDWLGFWAQFKKIDEDPIMHGSDKFWYLLQSLEPGSEAYEAISVYPQSDDHYPEAIKALKRQFGDEDMLLQHYIHELLKLIVKNVTEVDEKKRLPKTLHLKLDSHLRALNTLNLAKADPATWLFPLVLSTLPEKVQDGWQRDPLSSHDGSKDDPKRTRLELLMTFVEREVHIGKVLDITRGFASEQRVEKRENKPQLREKFQGKRTFPPTLQNFHVSDAKRCVFCEKTNHDSADCYTARNMSYQDKKTKLRVKGLCFNCCGKHIGRDCTAKNLECSICKRRHLTVLCRDFKGKKEDYNDGAPPNKKLRMEAAVKTTTNQSKVACADDVALQTLMVKIVNGSNEETVRAFIDSGSQRSYILKSTAKKLRLEPVGVERVVHSLFGGKTTSAVTHNKYEIKMRPVDGDGDFCQVMELRDQDKLCGHIPKIRARNSTLWRELEDNRVVIHDQQHSKSVIEILIGADFYASIITGNVVNLACGAVAIQTKLGWTIMGKISTGEIENNLSNLCISMNVNDRNVSKLWELDALGMRDPVEESTRRERAEKALKDFERNITRLGNGRYEVALPWKQDPGLLLGTNWEAAFKRLQSASRKLNSTGLFGAYSAIFKDWETEGFIERCSPGIDSERVHYLPHRPVIKPESLTTKVRPVFDASCRMGKAPSLNDLLLTGENLMQIIPDLLLTFREKRVGFVADIRKAFQMIGVAASERDVMRFLWWNNEKMEDLILYRHARVMFGATCSPFILGAVLAYHLGNVKAEQKEMGKKLLKTFYVDNCVHSEETIEEYHSFRDEAVELLGSAQMELRMWLSNVDGFEDEATHVVSVLGLMWDRKRDELYVNTKSIVPPEKVSRRAVLSIVQRVFDPIGFTSPAVLPMKVLLQATAKSKLKWDEEIGEKEKDSFNKWVKDVAKLGEVRIPRLATGGVAEKATWSLHTFTDGSRTAYSAAVFLRVELDGLVSVQLLGGKARVAPMKALTVNKLELMGCLMGARLAASVKRAIGMDGVKEFYWSDSTTAIAWVKRTSEWGMFVMNRTREIRELTNGVAWRHVPGTANPADLPSRGCSPSQLLRTKWWEGPSWLYEEEGNWPTSNEGVNEEEVGAELKKSPSVVNVTAFSVVARVRKQYSVASLIRIVGYVRRFLFNKFVTKIEYRKTDVKLSGHELYKAELVFWKSVQAEAFSKADLGNIKGLEIFRDDWGVLRVKTRLTFREEPSDFKFPILLPSKREEVRQMIINVHREFCHAGLGFLMAKIREKYWVLRARQTIKSVLSHCLKCQRFKAKPSIPETAPLPLNRVKDAEVFECVGVDLAGPLILKNGRKMWLVIITCAVYRAVHFELVGSLSTNGFIEALGSFIGKYRRPAVIYSDNGTNFRGAANLFKSVEWERVIKRENLKQIEWRFSPANSAWWGGWWERLIRTAKDLLRRTVGKKTLNGKELETVIKTVEEAMNGRPLTYVSENPDELEPLTPALFLRPFGGVQFPEGELNEAQKMRYRIKYVRKLQEELKGRFRKEYLAYLVNRSRPNVTRELKVGELVLVGSDNVKRLEWPLGKVLELIEGKDGNIRLAKVKTERGEFVRPLQRLFPLEMDGTDPRVGVREKATTTFSGRKVKQPERFE